MNINNLVLLLGFTARSQAYMHALRHYNIQPNFVILYGDKKHQTAAARRNSKAVFHSKQLSPNLTESLLASINSFKIPYTHIINKDLESKQLIDILIQQDPTLTLFSGYGGQNVPDVKLRTTNKMLHIHPWRLPEYRDSTTTAIRPIIARKEYSISPPRPDIDYLYDNTIRANLLIDFFKSYIKNASFSDISKQPLSSDSYYIIHSVYKNLSLLKIDQNV